MRAPETRSSFSARWLKAAGAALLLATAAAAQQGPIAGYPPTSPSTPAVDFSSVWNVAAPETTLDVRTSFTEFWSQVEELSAKGLKLEAFETWTADGNRNFAGLFRPGTGDRYFAFNLSATDFATVGDAQYDLDRRLIDVEVRLVDGQRVYAGLWAPGSGNELWLNNLTAAEFESQWADHAAEYHIVAFDTWWDGSQVRVFGTLGAGAEPATAQISVALPWTSFAPLVYSLSVQGYRLIDFDAAPVTGSDDYFSARWIPATHVRNWLGVYFTEFWMKQTNWLFNSGFDFSAVNLPGTFILPTPPTTRMDMQDLEVTTDCCYGTIVLGKPLIDSGTPGPPRPPMG